MIKRRIEYLFLMVLIACLYGIFYQDLSSFWNFALAGVYFFIIFITMFSLMLEERSPSHTLLWMNVLLFYPIFGYFFYLFSGQLYLKGYLFKRKRRLARTEWERLMRKEVTPDLSFLQDNQQSFAKIANKTALTPISTGSRATMLKNGHETFTEIKKKLREAKKFIHIEYYIFRSDRLGKELMGILIEKAHEGVEVLFMFDAAGSLALSARDIKKMEEAGIKVHSFSPLKYGFFNQKFNFRNHRKIIVIDGEIGFVGGLNVGVEYLGENENFGFWRDTHLFLTGEAVYSLHQVFLLDWEYVSGEQVIGNHVADKSRSPVDNNEIDGAIQVVASGPDTQQGIMGNLFFAMMTSATQSIWIATPYFIPNEAIRTALKAAAGKGLDVKILVPEVNDSFLTHYASQSYFAELLRNGVEIYMYKKGFLHQKVLIVDGNLASIGTANMDMRSFHLNFEVNVFLYDSSSIRDLVAHYEEDLEDSEKIGAIEHYKRSWISKTKESFARLFSGVL
ncbi:cardiolipin synthase [Mesobacillus campisalis]|uniref:Cardiolipin synthase n=1 Tax=Mesobacillus campisalis TaxID=1408103 RepID=A0A0M2SVF3_9BACI|nr:cardiolipin synthase [Mesobacillus campisalis]KKK36937.1 cardiolipin synthase [Mesobacillus campisalis]